MLTPTRRLSNLYLPSDQNDQTQTNSPIPMADSQSYAAGDFDVFRSRIYSPVEHFHREIANRGKSRPRKRAGPQRDEFRAAVKSRRRIMRETRRIRVAENIRNFFIQRPADRA